MYAQFHIDFYSKFVPRGKYCNQSYSPFKQRVLIVSSRKFRIHLMTVSQPASFEIEKNCTSLRCLVI